MKRAALAMALATVSVSAVMACEKPEPLRVETPPPVSAGAEAGAEAGAAADPAVAAAGPVDAAVAAVEAGVASSRCATLAAQFDAVRAAAGGTCARDTDCACYADLRFSGRTEISDARSASELGRLAAEYGGRHCPTADVLVSGSHACKARCEAGSCR